MNGEEKSVPDYLGSHEFCITPQYAARLEAAAVRDEYGEPAPVPPKGPQSFDEADDDTSHPAFFQIAPSPRRGIGGSY